MKKSFSRFLKISGQEAALYENSTYYESEPVPVGTVLGAAGDYQRENAGQEGISLFEIIL